MPDLHRIYASFFRTDGSLSSVKLAVSEPLTYGEAVALHERLHNIQRDRYGAMRLTGARPVVRPGFIIGGRTVAHLSVRSMDDTNWPRTGRTHELSIPAQEVNSMSKSTKSTNVKTPGGIARPKSGGFVTYDAARTVAKRANVAQGRGRRALKAQDGNYAVIFRPAVAANKQRRVRALDPTV